MGVGAWIALAVAAFLVILVLADAKGKKLGLWGVPGPSQIQSEQDCHAAGGTAYGYCPESGVHYCVGVCDFEAACAGNSNRTSACSKPMPKSPDQIKSRQDCLDSNGTDYGYCPETGIHYCDGVCTGRSTCLSGHLSAGACSQPNISPHQIKSRQDCLALNGTDYGYCPETGVHYCDGVCTGHSKCLSGHLGAGACNPPRFAPADIKSEAACLAMNGTYDYCQANGVAYCHGVCKKNVPCPGGKLNSGACQDAPPPLKL